MCESLGIETRDSSTLVIYLVIIRCIPHDGFIMKYVNQIDIFCLFTTNTNGSCYLFHYILL